MVGAWRWPQGFVCPRCHGNWCSAFRRQERLCFQFRACRYQCSLVSGTNFKSSRPPRPGWFLAIRLMMQAKSGVSALELKRRLGVSYSAA